MADATTVRRSMPEATRRAVALRHGAIPGETTAASCERCGAAGLIFWPRLFSGRPGAWVSFSKLELDHIHPVVHGGSGQPENVALLCRDCNRRKGAKLEWLGSR